MPAKRMCPRCDEPLDAKCAGCGSLFIPLDELTARVADFLARNGHEDGIVAFHEAPVCESPYDCPDCRRPMARVRLRAVAVERCTECNGLLLDTPAVELISRRVLVSARTRGPVRPVAPTRNPRLDAPPSSRRRLRPED